MQFASSDSLPPAPLLSTAYQVVAVIYLAPFQLQSTSQRANYHLALRTVLHVFLKEHQDEQGKGEDRAHSQLRCQDCVPSRAPTRNVQLWM